MQQRNLQFDILRLAAAFGVVWLHAAATVILKPGIDYNGLVWWVANGADSLSRWTVPFFVMISGALLLNDDKPRATFHFYIRRFQKIFLPLVFWTGAYLVYRLFHDHQAPAQLFKDTLKGYPYYHLWFLYMMLGLYAVTPLLKILVANCSRNTLIAVIASIFFVAAIDDAAVFIGGIYTSTTFQVLWLPYTAYFLAGWLLAKRTQYLSVPLAIILALIFCIFLTIENGLIRFGMGRHDVYWYTYDNFNPLIVVPSLILYSAFAHFSFSMSEKTGRMIQSLSGLTLGIYVIHPFWLHILEFFHCDGLLFHPSIGIPVTTIAAFSLSLATAALFRKLPILSRTI